MTANITPTIIGSSPKFQALLSVVARVAPVDSAVLIQGETGTGKEVIARAIHEASPRRNNRFVALNCAAIPGALLESELFGHERGAFTGAWAQTKGRFQMADGGTLFLDEIGDMPLELQPKLLRALQEQEFERLGGGQTVRVNVRVVAATNQDLAELVSKKLFRADLFYRLNVIAICLPPLRERAQDILPLTEFFVAKFAASLNKPIDLIPHDEVITVLRSARLAGQYSRTAEFPRTCGALFAGIGAASAVGLQAEGDAELRRRFRHAGRRQSRAHPGNLDANRLADRGTGRSGQPAWIAAYHADLQDAKTWN